MGLAGNCEDRGSGLGAHCPMEHGITVVKIRRKLELYEDPEVKGADGQPAVTRVLTIMLAEEY